MGQEDQILERQQVFKNYQVNLNLLKNVRPRECSCFTACPRTEVKKLPTKSWNQSTR